MGAKQRSAFVIGPIGDKGSETRKDADDFIELVLLDTLEAAGFQSPVRADMITTAGQITRDITDHLINSDVVIADLRKENVNVYYELSFRNVFRKAVISFAQEGKSLPFDLKDSRVISLEIGDSRSVHEAKQLLGQYARDLPSPGAAQSVWSVTADSLSLEQGSSIERAIARILETTELLPSIHQQLSAGRDSIMYETAQSVLQEVNYGPLERIVFELQGAKDECSARCLQRIREIEKALLDFAAAPHLRDGV